ncbi:uncharacterized protein [Watersipora subatra]|uniref:uncharacterized protein isoform X2 n=1 Tax=Watersipora subatra TaxID=2589382 RepID=UPI00355AD807
MMAESQPNYEVLVETLPSDQLISFINDHPEIATIRFWHGQSALHKACLRPEISVDVVRCLIKVGADVNAGNNFKETPLMFAAKRGSSALCQFLLDSGGDATISDKAGRSFIHHAVMGGSVYLAHYLYKVYDFSLEVEDDRKQTPLHVAASQGNLLMVNYLLRTLQCDAKKADVFGNTALHHAATYGHDQIVSSLLVHCGLSAMEAVNQKDQTPMQVCVGKGSAHLATNQVFLYAIEQKKKGYNNLQPPRFLWFWYLIMPVTFFVVGGLIAELVQALVGWYSGSLVMAPFLFYIVYLFQVHQHRIKHFTRLPNPMYAGAFAAGLVGTFIVWLIAVLPRLRITTDNWSSFMCLLTLFCVPVTYYCYWKLMTINPGYVPLPEKGALNGPAAKIDVRSEDAARFCSYCDTYSGAHVKHCKLCERCVVNMDHHCLFLLKCVAARNHRLFTIMITFANADIILFLTSTCHAFTKFYGHPGASRLLSYMASERIFVLFVVIVNVFSCLWGLVLLQWQLRLISEGRTFYESIKGEGTTTFDKSNLSFRVRLQNIVRFFLGAPNTSNNSTTDVV